MERQGENGLTEEAKVVLFDTRFSQKDHVMHERTATSIVYPGFKHMCSVDEHSSALLFGPRPSLLALDCGAPLLAVTGKLAFNVIAQDMNQTNAQTPPPLLPSPPHVYPYKPPLPA